MRDSAIVEVLREFRKKQELERKEFQVEFQMAVKSIVDVLCDPPRFYLGPIPLWHRRLTAKDFDAAFRDVKQDFLNKQTAIIKREEKDAEKVP